MLLFRPETPPSRYEPEYFFRQFLLLQSVLDLLSGQIEPTARAPDKPRDGMLRYADGISWDPGSGRGLYLYVSTEWVALGTNAPQSTRGTSRARQYFYSSFRRRTP